MNCGVWLTQITHSTSDLTTPSLHMMVTKTSTMTDKSSRERLMVPFVALIARNHVFLGSYVCTLATLPVFLHHIHEGLISITVFFLLYIPPCTTAIHVSLVKRIALSVGGSESIRSALKSNKRLD